MSRPVYDLISHSNYSSQYTNKNIYCVLSHDLTIFGNSYVKFSSSTTVDYFTVLDNP